MIKSNLGVWIILTGIFLSRCSNDDDVAPNPGLFSDGVFIVNEGPFQTGTGTVSFLDRISGSVTNEIFQTANGRPLGNIVQSLQIHENRAFIVVNNANKMEVVDLEDFSSVGIVENLPLPRYFLGLNASKGYITSWGSGGVSGQVDVLDLQSLSVTKTIKTGSGSEKMAIVGSSLFVCNGGGFGMDSTVSVINTQNDELEDPIVVGGNPNSIQVDATGMIWVACAGIQVYNSDFSINPDQSTEGSLVRIDPITREVVSILQFPDVFSSPSRLVTGSGGTILYYLRSGSIYSQDINSNTLASQPIVQSFFYGLGYEEASGLIYATDPIDFASTGRVIRYTSSGTAQDTLSVGIIPSDFYFN